MIERSLGQVAKMTEGQIYHPESAHLRIKGVSSDSRRIQAGMLFVPLIGAFYDGHDYVLDSIKQGAATVLWQADHGAPPSGVDAIIVDNTLAALQRLAAAYRRELQVKVIGITGSNGKTTTKDMIGSILSTTYRVVKTQGNLNNHIGLPLTLLQLDEDTEYAVIEMGMSELGEISLLSRIAAPDMAVITYIGESHLLQLGSKAAIAKAKLEIMDGMAANSQLIYPGDEPLLVQPIQDIVSQMPLKRVCFGDGTHQGYSAKEIKMENNGMSFALATEEGWRYFIPVVGRHHVRNALAAIAVGQLCHLSAAKIQAGLAGMQSSGMRNELISTSQGITIMNDAFNASPSSMRAALQVLAEMNGYQRKIAVLADMLELGTWSESYHREIGMLLQPDVVDYVFTYGPQAEYIAEAAKSSFAQGHVRSFQTHDALLSDLLPLIAKGDFLLLKGSRGMQLEKIANSLQS